MSQIKLSALPRLRIGPAEQAAGEFLEAHMIDPADYHVDEWGGELEYEAWVELRARGIVK